MSDKSQLDVDTEINKANLTLARGDKLLSILLPSKGPSKSEQELEQRLKDEDKYFAQSGSDTLGVGGREAPKDAVDDMLQQSLVANDNLRRQLLGNDMKQFGLFKGKKGDQLVLHGQESQPKPKPQERKPAAKPKEESDDEEGKTAMLKPKKGKKRHVDAEEDPEQEKGKGSGRRSTSYLDEVLAKREKKKAKKHKK